MQQDDRNSTQEQKNDKFQKRIVIQLYLHVLYQLLKHLVSVNSRYFLAFHCVERDSAIYDSQSFNYSAFHNDYTTFVRKFYSEHPRTDRVGNYLGNNLSNADPWAIKNFRNCVAHLSAIRNANIYIGDIRCVSSYFELYHYLVQRYLMDKFVKDFHSEKVTSKISRRTFYQLNMAKERGEYSKDFLKGICVPFAYNLPRYKDLTIEGLFDRNNMHGSGSNALLEMASYDE